MAISIDTTCRVVELLRVSPKKQGKSLRNLICDFGGCAESNTFKPNTVQRMITMASTNDLSG